MKISTIVMGIGLLSTANRSLAQQRVTVQSDGDVIVEGDNRADAHAGRVGIRSVGENHEHRRLHISIGAGLADSTENGFLRPQFEESIAYRFMDHDRGGIFAGVAFGQSFDSRASTDVTLLQFAFRMGAELPFYANNGMHLYGVPFVQAGLQHVIASSRFGSSNDSQFFFGMGGELRLSFADDFIAIFLRPLQLNFVHVDGAKRFSPEYQFLGGVALRF